MIRPSMWSSGVCLLFALALMPLRAICAHAPTPPSLIPLPAQLQAQPGSFTV